MFIFTVSARARAAFRVDAVVSRGDCWVMAKQPDKKTDDLLFANVNAEVRELNADARRRLRLEQRRIWKMKHPKQNVTQP